MEARRPLWVIGLDGLEPHLLKQWCAQGALPTLARLADAGVTGRLWSTPNQLTCSAWVTVATGANPGAHGVYNFQERVPRRYLLKLPTGDDRKLPAFWEHASGTGLSVVTARVPMSYPVRPVNGIQVSDWLAPSTHAPGFVYPESLRQDVVRRYPHSYWLEPVDLLRTAPKKALRMLLQNIDRTFDLFRYLLSRLPADLFFGVLRESDLAGHLFWDYHSGMARGDTPRETELLQGALLAVYQRLDSGLGELLAGAPEPPNVMVVSDHGMGSFPHAPRCVVPVLEAAGLMQSRQPEPAPRRPLSQRLTRRLARGLPWALRRRLRPLRARDWTRGFTQEHLSGIDFSASQAFSYMSILTGEIWLNVQGRDPEGMVRQGMERYRLEDELISLFTNCEDAATGQPVVGNVWRRDELFRGPYRDILADLHVQFDPDATPQTIATRYRGERLEVTLPGPAPRGGMHRPYGVFVGCGPDIESSPRPLTGTLMDVAPTALALLGLPSPASVEGHVLLQTIPPRSQNPTEPVGLPAGSQSLH